MQVEEYEFEDDFGNTITIEEQPNQMGGVNYVIVTDDDDIGMALYTSMELFFKENGFLKTRDTTEED